MSQSKKPALNALDHLVLTVRDLEDTIDFYTRVLGMTSEVFPVADGSTRKALKFGQQKINLHPAGAEFDPKSARPTPGSADLCFLTETEVPIWIEHLSEHNVHVEEGPVSRTGATGSLVSLYVRDPDGNLIEISRLQNN